MLACVLGQRSCLKVTGVTEFSGLHGHIADLEGMNDLEYHVMILHISTTAWFI